MWFSYRNKRCRIPAFAGMTLCLLAAMPAKAEVYQWGNPGISLSVTFPDTWRRAANQKPDDVITIVAPSDNATCRLRVREDRRFVIYPREFAAAVQRTNFSYPFWDDYAGEFSSARINQVADNQGVGRGFASSADLSFVADSGKQMRGIAYAANYNDNTYVFECSAETNAYGNWHNMFLSVLKSVDMRSEYTQQVNGTYRDFQNDGKWKIHGVREVDTYIYP